MNRSVIVQRLLVRIQREAGARRRADAPTYDMAGINVDHEG